MGCVGTKLQIMIRCALNCSSLQELHGVFVTCSHEVSSHMGMAPETGQPFTVRDECLEPSLSALIQGGWRSASERL